MGPARKGKGVLGIDPVWRSLILLLAYPSGALGVAVYLLRWGAYPGMEFLLPLIAGGIFAVPPNLPLAGWIMKLRGGGEAVVNRSLSILLFSLEIIFTALGWMTGSLMGLLLPFIDVGRIVHLFFLAYCFTSPTIKLIFLSALIPMGSKVTWELSGQGKGQYIEVRLELL